MRKQINVAMTPFLYAALCADIAEACMRRMWRKLQSLQLRKTEAEVKTKATKRVRKVETGAEYLARLKQQNQISINWMRKAFAKPTNQIPNETNTNSDCLT
jgi:CRISPR/Cas system CSM-associated protein Csm2 small subunit